MMPEMDGETLGRTIKDDPILRDTTILVMLSSDTWRSNSKRLKEIGFADHLTKPIRPSRLFERLAIALGQTVTETDIRQKTTFRHGGQDGKSQPGRAGFSWRKITRSTRWLPSR